MTIDRDNTRALITDTRTWIRLHRENKFQAEAAKRMARLADALESALSAVPVEGEQERALMELRMLGADIPARFRQAAMLAQAGMPPAEVEAVIRAWARGAHPAEETDWEYRRVTPAGNPRRDAIFESPPDLDEGWTMERRAVGPWSPAPTDGEGQPDA